MKAIFKKIIDNNINIIEEENFNIQFISKNDINSLTESKVLQKFMI